MQVLNTLNAMRSAVNSLIERHPFAWDVPFVMLDIETTGLDPLTDKLVMVQLSVLSENYIFDCRKLAPFIGDILNPLLSQATIVGHNLGFDGYWLAHYGIHPSRFYDTQLAEQVIYGLGLSDATVSGIPMHLASVVKRRLGREMSKAERNWFIGLDTRPAEWNAPFPPEQLAYAEADITCLEPIWASQQVDIEAKHLQAAVELEMDCLPAIIAMKQTGVRIDVAGWRERVQELNAEARALENDVLLAFGDAILAQRHDDYTKAMTQWETYRRELEAHEDQLRAEYTGTTWGAYKVKAMQEWRATHTHVARPQRDTGLVNVDSPAQLMVALQRLGIPAPSTRTEVLKEMDDPRCDTLVQYRMVRKLVVAFGESLLEKVGVDGRIHPDYQQIGASTGRMSCSQPNWQQIPSKGAGAKFRQLVVAAPGHKLLTCDFSNIELRILADMSGDEAMLGFFAAGQDVHEMTARMMFNLPDTMTKAEVKDKYHGPVPGKSYRDVGKVIGLGLGYGMGVRKLARTIGVDTTTAKGYLDAYFTLYAGVRQWLDQTKAEGLQRMQSRTPLGRVRYYRLGPEPRRGNQTWDAYKEALDTWKGQRARIERQATNTPIQGDSADITKTAMVLWHNRASTAGRLATVVHDELVVEARDEDVDEAKYHLESAMDQAAKQFLHRVHLPWPEAHVAECWEKE